MVNDCDTIAAISTAVGNAGIGIVRISGDEAFTIAARVFKPKGRRPSSFSSFDHRVVYGSAVDGNGMMIDECLCLCMKAPRSFTTEDIVELHCHGGAVPVYSVLQAILGAGARLADPGEFTKRAFLNGRMDLSQAEAVDDIIKARTEKTLDLALKQLQGGLGRKVASIRKDMIKTLAYIEAYIDFSDDIGEIDTTLICKKTKHHIEQLHELIRATENGKIYKEGAIIVIIGKPNAGKSSLLNALLRENRAIVTEIAGTTRDLIEESLNIRGIPIRLVDTAGIRETIDVVEQIGVEKAKSILNLSDLVLFITDSSQTISEEDISIAKCIGSKPTICLMNKVDLPLKALQEDISPYIENCMDVIDISIPEAIGIGRVEEQIYRFLLGGYREGDPIFLINIRQKKAIESALTHLIEAKSSLAALIPVDLLSINYREAIDRLGEITGESIADDVINEIFANFCVGK